MQKKILTLIIALYVANFKLVYTQDNPKLVIGIIVDQMRWEYLNRFKNDFGNNGFIRMMKDGFEFSNAHFNYVPTYTGPGHASIYTGTTPNIHGIVGNKWYHRQKQKIIYCVEDSTVQSVTGDTNEGQMSPSKLQVTTISDELKLFSIGRSKVIGISIKDRGAILPVGHLADAAYWYSKSGDMISSTYYMEELPSWVKEFNKNKLHEKLIQNGWGLILEKNNYTESRKDNNSYEGKFGNKKTPTLPYDLQKMYNEHGAAIIRSTPHGNSFLAEFAKRAIINENMGKNEYADFLAISFSSTDYVGHIFGPYSREIQDMYIRLDRTIANFLKFLDGHLGSKNYLLFLTADHAVAPNALYLKSKNIPVDLFYSKKLHKKLTEFSMHNWGVNLIKNFSNLNLFLDEKIMVKNKLKRNEVIQYLKQFILSQKGVKRVFTQQDLTMATNVDYLANLFFKGYDPKQNGDILVALNPGWVDSYRKTGTTHGSPYSYDTHVPLLWYGTKIPSGKSRRKVYVTEIAPTLSQMLGISMPNATNSSTLIEILKNF